ncbi:MAG: CHAD domain-containing protein [marine benthic group bacterium]|jgi:CHAD domain-containing protein/CYTH domain-containing protein|nr:CHAD domain-containing protein [Candidatus Carthagonibacter metallireducens]MCL7969159.1 CHAD domain-containing protein [Gemmatimonadota bacterium]MCL7974243.1 CHAD domain-containing protein [Gemmatimonadota bacterium]MCL7983246.1 CHAD domain-containing protein [Gemmatimonadota bacterium]MCL7984853.1 CHAD domain-containing protein [Gemmatimonadota bacterium]
MNQPEERESGILEAPATESIRRIALGHLDSAKEALARMNAGDEDEALHDFRVSLRRLRTILKAYRPLLEPEVRKKDRRAIRRLTRRTGGGRDAEVLLAWLESVQSDLAPSEGPMADRLAAELRDERDAGYGAVLDMVGPRFRKIEKRLRSRLESYGLPDRPTRPGEERSFAAVLGRLFPVYAADLAEAVAEIHTPEDHDAVHATRIRGKHLRYLIEALEPEVEGVDALLKRLKGLQDALGDLRDAQLLELRVRASDLAGDGSGDSLDPGEAELGALLRKEQSEKFAEFQAGWQGAARGEFLAEVEAIRRCISDAAPDPLEIERKYLLSGPPAVTQGRTAREIEQGYLPGDRIQERLRRITESDRILHVRSIKLGGGLVRVEVQEEIDPELFDRLWPLTEGRRLTKNRYRFAAGGLVWEVDEFTDRDLWLAEVELASADQESSPPDWLEPLIVREVTDDPDYLNVNLAR